MKMNLLYRIYRPRMQIIIYNEIRTQTKTNITINLTQVLHCVYCSTSVICTTNKLQQRKQRQR